MLVFALRCLHQERRQMRVVVGHGSWPKSRKTGKIIGRMANLKCGPCFARICPRSVFLFRSWQTALPLACKISRNKSERRTPRRLRANRCWFATGTFSYPACCFTCSLQVGPTKAGQHPRGRAGADSENMCKYALGFEQRRSRNCTT